MNLGLVIWALEIHPTTTSSPLIIKEITIRPCITEKATAFTTNGTLCISNVVRVDYARQAHTKSILAMLHAQRVQKIPFRQLRV